MTSALALTRVSPELKIAIVEKQNILESNRKRDGRAYAISSASLKLFKEIGIFDVLQAEAGKISDIKITDYKSPLFLDFLGCEVGGDLGQIIENYHIHNALRDQILQKKNITIFAPNSYEDIEFASGPRNECGVANSSTIPSPVTPHLLQGPENVAVKLDNKITLHSKLLLACDGRFSKLREIFQIHTPTKKYHQTAIVFNIKHELSHQNIAHEKFLPGGPLAILPLKNSHHSSIVWIAPDQVAQAIMALDEKNFIAQLNKKMENILGKIEVISEKFSYPLIAIEAEKFFHQKMLLIGDAACGVHPIAGQGFNLAISGINILCELVKKNIDIGADISSENLIESYNKQTRFAAKKMLIATDILNSLFETKSLSISAARDFGLGLVNKLPRLKKFFIKSAGGF